MIIHINDQLAKGLVATGESFFGDCLVPGVVVLCVLDTDAPQCFAVVRKVAAVNCFSQVLALNRSAHQGIQVGLNSRMGYRLLK